MVIILYDPSHIDMNYDDIHCLSYEDMGHGDAQRCLRCGATIHEGLRFGDTNFGDIMSYIVYLMVGDTTVGVVMTYTVDTIIGDIMTYIIYLMVTRFVVTTTW